MSISLVKYLLLGVIVLNLLVIIGTNKFKRYEPLISAKVQYKREGINLLKSLWKKQIILIAIGVTLFISSILIKDNTNYVAIKTFEVMANIYILIAALLATYNYNNFNRNIANILNKINS